MSYDLIVIGAGPGGYVCAIRAAQLGMKVACVEKDSTLGGTCLNVGCIPSKALLESSELFQQAKAKLKDHGVNVGDLTLDFQKMMSRKVEVVEQLTGGVAHLFKKNKVDSIVGPARIRPDRLVAVQTRSSERILQGKNIVIATGSKAANLPGVEIDQEVIVDSTGALALKKVPKKLLVIGGGYIGLELGSVYLRLGSEVAVVEALDRIVPGMDTEVGKTLHKILQKQGMSFQLSTKVKRIERRKDSALVTVEAEGKETELTADVVLVAIGRKPNTDGLGLKEAGIQTDDKGRVVVDANFQTNLPGVYAIGDVIDGPMLAHKASEEGVAVAEILAGQAGHVNYFTIPSVIYTWPEVASVGLTEEEAKEKGIEYSVSKFPFLGNGRALALGEKDGWVKLMAEKNTDRLIGAHIMGPRASDLIAELVVAMEFKASAEDIARTVHAHPTLAEAVKEAALGLGDGAIHI